MRVHVGNNTRLDGIDHDQYHTVMTLFFHQLSCCLIAIQNLLQLAEKYREGLQKKGGTVYRWHATSMKCSVPLYVSCRYSHMNILFLSYEFKDALVS